MMGRAVSPRSTSRRRRAFWQMPVLPELARYIFKRAVGGLRRRRQQLDILLTGYDGSVSVAKIYEQTAPGVFTELALATPGLTGVNASSAQWGDYDADGDLDILLTGEGSSGRVAKIYEQTTAGMFTELATAELTGVYSSSAQWGTTMPTAAPGHSPDGEWSFGPCREGLRADNCWHVHRTVHRGAGGGSSPARSGGTTTPTATWTFS